MRSFVRNHFAWLFLTVIVIVIVWCIYGSEELQDCICKEHNAYTQQAPKERSPLLFFAFRNYGGCVWHWLDRNNGAIIALATLIIAFFTIKIFREERDRTKRELRAYVGVAYPKLVIKKESGAEKLLVIMKYVNAGQTPAKKASLHMRAAAYSYFVEGSPKPPWKSPDNARDEGKGGILVPNIEWVRHCGVENFTNSLIDEMRNKAKTVWVWGTICYDDIFDEKNEVRFRFSSSDYERDFDVPEHSREPMKGFALIPDIEFTTAEYGKK